jgi:hypothetical protein
LLSKPEIFIIRILTLKNQGFPDRQLWVDRVSFYVWVQEHCSTVILFVLAPEFRARVQALPIASIRRLDKPPDFC